MPSTVSVYVRPLTTLQLPVILTRVDPLPDHESTRASPSYKDIVALMFLPASMMFTLQFAVVPEKESEGEIDAALIVA